LKDQQDAYGHEIFDYLRGKPAVEVVERDDGFMGAGGGALAYFRPYKEWSQREKRAMGYVRGQVLDIGCGAGRCSLYLQRKGFRVTGIDLSPLAVRVSELRGVKHVRNLSITRLNPSLGTFDTLLMMGNNFGLFGSFKQAKHLLQTFHRMTSPNGRIIAESVDPYKTTDPFHLTYHKRNRRRGRMSGQVRIRVRYRGYIGPWFDYLLVSRNEMKTIVKGTGWKVRRFIGSKGPAYTGIIDKE
jgi:SAM-dependent methyltransferase